MLGCRALLKQKRGQAVVEFALVLPVFILILVGIMEFGLVFHQYLVVTSASREGARVAALGGTDADVAAVVTTAVGNINQGLLTTAVSPAARTRGDAVTVTVTNRVPIQTPLFSQFLTPNPYPLVGTTIMRVE